MLDASDPDERHRAGAQRRRHRALQIDAATSRPFFLRQSSRAYLAMSLECGRPSPPAAIRVRRPDALNSSRYKWDPDRTSTGIPSCPSKSLSQCSPTWRCQEGTLTAAWLLVLGAADATSMIRADVARATKATLYMTPSSTRIVDWQIR
jgi:hypothetical protein